MFLDGVGTGAFVQSSKTAVSVSVPPHVHPQSCLLSVQLLHPHSLSLPTPEVAGWQGGGFTGPSEASARPGPEKNPVLPDEDPLLSHAGHSQSQ